MRKNFLIFHALFAITTFFSVLTAILLTRNVFLIMKISIVSIHIISGVILSSSFLLLFITKQGRSAMKTFRNFSSPKISDIKRGNIFLFSFKILNVLFILALFFQMASGIIVATGFLYRYFIYRLHTVLLAPILLVIILHGVLGVMFHLKTKKLKASA